MFVESNNREENTNGDTSGDTSGDTTRTSSNGDNNGATGRGNVVEETVSPPPQGMHVQILSLSIPPNFYCIKQHYS